MSGTRIASRARALAVASHALPTAAMTIAISALLAAAGWRGAQLALGAAAVLAGQLSVGWANDAHDAELDRAVSRAAKPVVAGHLEERALMRAAQIMLAVSVVLSIVAAWPAGLWHVAAVLSAWAYDLRLSRTRWSWLPYAISFACLAPFATLGAPEPRWPLPWVVVALAAIGVAAHAANALPDLARDRAAGVGGMATWLGERWTRTVAAIGLALATACLATALPAGAFAFVVIVSGAAVLLAAFASPRAAFAGVIGAGFAAIGAIAFSGALSVAGG